MDSHRTRSSQQPEMNKQETDPPPGASRRCCWLYDFSWRQVLELKRSQCWLRPTHRWGFLAAAETSPVGGGSQPPHQSPRVGKIPGNVTPGVCVRSQQHSL